MRMHAAALQKGFRLLILPTCYSHAPFSRTKELLFDNVALRNVVLELPIQDQSFKVWAC